MNAFFKPDPRSSQTNVLDSNGANKRTTIRRSLSSLTSAFVDSQQGALMMIVGMTLATAGAGLALTLGFGGLTQRTINSSTLQGICEGSGRVYLNTYFSGDGASHDDSVLKAEQHFRNATAQLNNTSKNPSEWLINFRRYTADEWRKNVKGLGVTVNGLVKVKGAFSDDLGEINFRRRMPVTGGSLVGAAREIGTKVPGSVADIEFIHVSITAADATFNNTIASGSKVPSGDKVAGGTLEAGQASSNDCHLLAYDIFQIDRPISFTINALMLGEGNNGGMLYNYPETQGDDLSGGHMFSGSGAFCYYPDSVSRNANHGFLDPGALEVYRYQRGAPTGVDWINGKFIWGEPLGLIRKNEAATIKALREVGVAENKFFASTEGIIEIVGDLSRRGREKLTGAVLKDQYNAYNSPYGCTGMFDAHAIGARAKLQKHYGFLHTAGYGYLAETGKGLSLDNAQLWAPFYFYKGLYPLKGKREHYSHGLYPFKGQYSDWYGHGISGNGPRVNMITSPEAFQAWNLSFEPRIPWVGKCYVDESGTVFLESEPWGEEALLKFMRKNGYAGWRTSQRFLEALDTGKYKKFWPKVTEFVQKSKRADQTTLYIDLKDFTEVKRTDREYFRTGGIPSYIPFAYRDDPSVKWDEVAHKHSITDMLMSGRYVGPAPKILGGPYFDEYYLHLPSYHFSGPPGSMVSLGYDADGPNLSNHYAEYNPEFQKEVMKLVSPKAPAHPVDDIFNKPLPNKSASYYFDMPGHPYPYGRGLTGPTSRGGRGYGPPIPSAAFPNDQFNKQELYANAYGWGYGPHTIPRATVQNRDDPNGAPARAYFAHLSNHLNPEYQSAYLTMIANPFVPYTSVGGKSVKYQYGPFVGAVSSSGNPGGTILRAHDSVGPKREPTTLVPAPPPGPRESPRPPQVVSVNTVIGGPMPTANYQQPYFCRTRSPLWPSGRNSCEIHLIVNPSGEHAEDWYAFSSVAVVRQASWLNDVHQVNCARSTYGKGYPSEQLIESEKRLEVFGLQVLNRK